MISQDIPPPRVLTEAELREAAGSGILRATDVTLKRGVIE
jgi:hypothetical protein